MDNHGDEDPILPRPVVHTYDEALKQTINRKPGPQMGVCKRFMTQLTGKLGILQLLSVIAFELMLSGFVYLIVGGAFLNRIPKHFECYSEEDDSWRDCSKDEICANNLDQAHFRGKDEDDYMDNWAAKSKFNLICENKFKVGLLSSLYFIGMVCTCLIIPPLADLKFGRKILYNSSMFIYVTCFLLLIFANDINEAYVLMFFIGAT